MTSHKRTIVGRLIRGIDRKAGDARQKLVPILLKAEGLMSQQHKHKNKVHAWHADKVTALERWWEDGRFHGGP